MNTRLLISDLRKQKELLDQLIGRFQQKALLTEADLRAYDLTTRHIEKGLRGLRFSIQKKQSQNGTIKKPKGDGNEE